jgi:hypothetical protein
MHATMPSTDLDYASKVDPSRTFLYKAGGTVPQKIMYKMNADAARDRVNQSDQAQPDPEKSTNGAAVLTPAETPSPISGQYGLTTLDYWVDAVFGMADFQTLPMSELMFKLAVRVFVIGSLFYLIVSLSSKWQSQQQPSPQPTSNLNRREYPLP